MQHLINSLRPYRAREDLIDIAQAQIDSKKKLVQELREACSGCVACQEDARRAASDIGDSSTTPPPPTPSAANTAARDALAAIIARETKK